jgi:hypothetical protein
MKSTLIYPFNSERFYEAWNIWKQYKKEQFRFIYKGQISEQAALKSLAEMSFWTEETAIQMINQSIANGWRGIFQLKTKSTNGTKSIFEQLSEARYK